MIRRTLFLTMLILVFAGAWALYKWNSLRKTKFIRYPEFGISLPENYTVHGIDVSKYQDRIAWEEVQS